MSPKQKKITSTYNNCAIVKNLNAIKILFNQYKINKV